MSVSDPPLRMLGRSQMIYGTAWKELQTEPLTLKALRAGFVGIDTANQRRHYFEAGVGAALATAYREGIVQREGLFLQTKFTSRGGQDHRLPYDEHADAATQVQQSFASSLQHLGTSYLDAYVLHGPSSRRGIADYDRQVWRAMESLFDAGQARALGVSNVDRGQLEELHRFARVPPSYVQNRCYAEAGWDREVRAFCREAKIVYQGFSLLTANPHVLGHPQLSRAAAARGKTPAQLLFAHSIHLGILPLTGTTSELHMREDLQAVELELSEEEHALITAISSR